MKKFIFERYLLVAERGMTVLKVIMTTFFLLLVCSCVNASSKTSLKLSKNEVVDIYLKAMVHGKLDGVKNAIDDSVEVEVTLRANLVKLSKRMLLGYLKENKNVEQYCKCESFTIYDNGDGTFTKRIEMKYSDFTRVDIVTVHRRYGKWKIIKVGISFEQPLLAA